ncbi:MAG: type IX secretion system membrane protein PorP/SprF [Prevotellaceae bacterium]|jgi:type IX secretion system PorP/SprF family membrane protein|nr:type IX secretion system membrane protein PorP/SprF [Prevotellaceae bacterium]
MKLLRKYGISLVLLVLFLPCLQAQQEAMYTHYMYNTLGINPAYAGSRDALTVTALHRSQWVGFEGAPVTQTVTAHSPVRGDAVNLGLSFINDKIGPIRTTALFVDYAFRVQLTQRSKLAFGLKVGFNNYNFNLNELTLGNIGDGAFNLASSEFSPNVGFGVYYSTDNFYAGVSTPKLFNNSYVGEQLLSGVEVSKEQKHYYLIAGGLIPLTNDIKLKPTSFVKITEGAPVEVDVTGTVLFYDKFSLGLMYRTGDAVGALIGYHITEQFSAGYSFDWSWVNETGKYNSGSHEIVLRYDFMFGDQSRIRSPRYFCTF